VNKKAVWWIIGVIGFLIIASAVYLLANAYWVEAPKQQGQAQIQPTDQPPQSTQATLAGTYQDYSEQAFSESTAKNKLLFFYAAWCPQCHALEKSIEQNGVPSDVAIFKVNYDTESQLKQKYGVTMQTTFVEIDNDGNLIKKYVAYLKPNLPATLAEFGL